MRALEPAASGYVERGDGRLHWELFGAGEQTIVLLPTWSIVHSRFWKMQVPFLARQARVLTIDGRGNGLSDRPTDPAAYGDWESAANVLAVMDATGTERAALVSLSLGARAGLILAAEHPERVTAAAFIGPSAPLAEGNPLRDAVMTAFDVERDSYTGWEKYNSNYWRQDLRGFLEFFFETALPEPHSTKPLEDMVGWAEETTAEVLIATHEAPGMDQAMALDLARRIRCPVL
ncbi:MAG: alpha/beta hydrolase, partial [Chloroflexota bacterium]